MKSAKPNGASTLGCVPRSVHCLCPTLLLWLVLGGGGSDAAHAQVVDADRSSPGVVSAFQSMGDNTVKIALYKKTGDQFKLAATAELKGTITFHSKGIVGGAKNLLRLQLAESRDKWIPITKHELVGGRAVITTEDGKIYTIFNLGIGPFAGQVESGRVVPGAGPPSAELKQSGIRVGIIGTTTSHVPAFTGVMNDPKATGDLADVQVTAAFTGGIEDNPSSWGRRLKYTEELRKRGVKIYDTIPEMLQNVDAVLLEEVDGRPHLEWARPVIQAGKPLFIDKPMAGSLADCVEIARLAKEKNVPCFSSSSLRFGPGFLAARTGKSDFGQVKGCTAHSPMSKEPHHPDLYWYGIHGCEILFTIMGPGCKTVTREADNRVVGVWEDGRKGTFIGKKGYGAEVIGTKKTGDAGGYGGYKPLVIEIAKFFKTGKPPVSMEETLEIYTFMEAADESKRQGGKPVSMEEVLKKAQAANAARNK